MQFLQRQPSKSKFHHLSVKSIHLRHLNARSNLTMSWSKAMSVSFLTTLSDLSVLLVRILSSLRVEFLSASWPRIPKITPILRNKPTPSTFMTMRTSNMESMSSLMKSSQEWAVGIPAKLVIRMTPITVRHAWTMTPLHSSYFSVTPSQTQAKLPRSRKQPVDHMSIDKLVRILVLTDLPAMEQETRESVWDALRPA